MSQDDVELATASVAIVIILSRAGEVLQGHIGTWGAQTARAVVVASSVNKGSSALLLVQVQLQDRR